MTNEKCQMTNGKSLLLKAVATSADGEKGLSLLSHIDWIGDDPRL